MSFYMNLIHIFKKPLQKISNINTGRENSTMNPQVPITHLLQLLTHWSILFQLYSHTLPSTNSLIIFQQILNTVSLHS